MFGNIEVISFHTIMCMWLLIHAGIQLSKTDPRYSTAQSSLD